MFSYLFMINAVDWGGGVEVQWNKSFEILKSIIRRTHAKYYTVNWNVITMITVWSLPHFTLMMGVMMKMMINYFCDMVDQQGTGPLSENLAIVNLRHVATRVWNCTKPEFRLSWMHLCSGDNYYTTAPNEIVKNYVCM